MCGMSVRCLRGLLSGDALPTKTNNKDGWNMSGNADEAKGRVKEAAGDLTGDQSLKHEGKTDRAAGKAKDAVDKGADKVKDALRKD